MKTRVLKRFTMVIVALVFCFGLIPSLNLIKPLDACAVTITQVNKGCGNFTYTYTTSVANTSYSISNPAIGRVTKKVSGGKTTYTISSKLPNTSPNYVQTFAVYIKNSSGTVIKAFEFNQAAPVVRLNITSATVSCDSDRTVKVRLTTNADVDIYKVYGGDMGSFDSSYINGMTEDGSTRTYTVTFTSKRNDDNLRYAVYLFQYCGATQTCRITQNANDGFVYKDKWYSPSTNMTGPRPPCLTDTSGSSTKHYSVSAFKGNAYRFTYTDLEEGIYYNFTNSDVQAAAIANGIDIEYYAGYRGDLYLTIKGHRLKYATVESDVYGKQIKIVPVNYPTTWWTVTMQ